MFFNGGVIVIDMFSYAVKDEACCATNVLLINSIVFPEEEEEEEEARSAKTEIHLLLSFIENIRSCQ